MEGNLHHQHHHQHQLQQYQLQQQQQQQQHISVNVEASDKFPQWSIQETKEFLMIRAELDPTFMEKKRNKVLWEVISNKMKEKGYNRSAEQCKCKWKNLFTRYKGCETIEPEAMRQQFPFYNELQTIFTSRMQRMLRAEAEGAAATGLKKKAVKLSSDDEDENEEIIEGEKGGIRKKLKKGKTTGGTSGSGSINSLKECLEDFTKQQMQMEMQWREVFEARENERMMREMEWRRTMNKLENDRIVMERRWREREEQRRVREEARAERRDALITALLNKLRREEI
ncbi:TRANSCRIPTION FACTOR MYB FAMILY-RELATED [Salix purpurea]|uniref:TRANSCRIPTION FACTOR MYB FAMILY-RELATED n=1 Tax=Salix purpurea TaxID=77065 RepID=A0A9Q0VXZ8_SALPP|nr:TRANSCRIPTION FACTOR MYB FAMILY-RELATED [Salix purpurea]